MGTVFVGGVTLIWYVALGPAVAAAGPFGLANLVTFAYRSVTWCSCSGYCRCCGEGSRA